MCGIAGFISKDKDAPTAEREVLLDKMCGIITHRGPDEQGQTVSGRAALGMRRLSIIDLKGGQQPIYSEDGSKFIVFNGEIYNFRELKKELEELGYKFKTNSDTETIIHAYDEFDVKCLEKLRGMFAFAIWDAREESLFIARDRVGKKPLFFSKTASGDFLFGSELKSLLLHPGVSRKIDLAALDAYLTFGYVPEEFCIFKNIRKLAPGSFLIYKNGEIKIEEYWDFRYEKNEAPHTEGEYVEQLRGLIKEAVNVRLISEVPLGAFLSGGVDSSAVVGMMSEILDKPVKTFSIGFNEDSFDELKFARIAAKHFKTDHHEFIVTPDLVDIVDDLVWHFDEPFADPSALPTFMVAKLAREFVTVVLSGDGGDELFAGYDRYIIDKKRGPVGKLPKIFREAFLQRISKAMPHNARAKNFLYDISLDPVERYVNSISYFGAMPKSALYSDEFKSSLNGRTESAEAEFIRFAKSISTGNPVDKMLYLDSKTYLPGDILTKVDRMTMANSLEARVPLLDHKLIEFVQKIPAEMKLKGFRSKYIFKKALEGLVPDEILYREKQGFGVPIAEWINSRLRDRINGALLEKRTLERGYFNENYIKTLIDEHSRNRRDHSRSLWILWMLELWHRKFVDRTRD
ncbi:MAG: asparagine synthase (glutamine-hydrolyzing) [Pyrinomonadaceae bacterium]|nr:asparagine synthase (glutamine-hydrolyzing) [Pyrinomonadaceae bacterium]